MTPEERLAVLETDFKNMKEDFSAMREDVHAIKLAVDNLALKAMISRKFFSMFVALVGVVWPVISTALILLTR